MRSAALLVLVPWMLACSGRADNPTPPGGSGGKAGAGGAAAMGGLGGVVGSGGVGGAIGTGGAGTAGSAGEAGSTGAPGSGAGGVGEAGQAGEAGQVDEGGQAGEPAAVGYCGALTSALTHGSGVPASPLDPLDESPIAGSSCGAVERTYPLDPALHVEPCTEIAYGTNPPSSGAHYYVWAAFKKYTDPVPRGFWVHSMEHGAVVFAYSCSDCADEIAQAGALFDSLGADPACSTGETRLVLTPDPRLTTRWAAASWGATLTSDCFETDVFRAFAEAHRGHGPEAVCSDGIDVGD